MADAKIINYGQPIGAGSTAIPDNNATALDIESTDAKDYITIDTTDGDERIKFAQEVTVPDGAINNPSLRFTGHNSGFYDSGGNGHIGIVIDGSRIFEVADTHLNRFDVAKGFELDTLASTATNPAFTFNGDNDTGVGTSGDDELSLIAGGVERARLYNKGVTITGYGGTTGASPNEAEDVALYVENSNSNSASACVVELNTDGSSGSQVWFSQADALKGLVGYSNNKVLFRSIGSATDIVFEANSIDRLNIDADTGATKITGPLSTVGLVATALTGKMGTGGASSTTITGGTGDDATNFGVQLHVGSAIKIGSDVRTVTAIDSASTPQTLTVDSALTAAAGSSGTTDGGELFAVKNGDSKSILAVTGEGGLVLNSTGADSGIYNNLAIGDSDILAKVTTANRNYIIGHSNSDWDLTSADSCVIMGYNAGVTLTTGSNSTIIGGYAGDSVTTQQNITALGAAAGRASGSNSTHVGQNAGTGASGNNNVSVGKDAMSAFTGADSVAIGLEALDATSSTKATSIGYQSLTGLTATTEHNTALGYRAGLTLDDGDQCVFLGSTADTSDTDGNNQIAIGYGAVCDAPNKIMMGNHRNTDMTMDCPPITVKQTSTSGAGISLEHEGSTQTIAHLGEADNAGWFQLQKSDGTTTHKMLFGGSSFVNNTTTYNFGVSGASPNSNFHSFGNNAFTITGGGSLITASHAVDTHSTLLYDTSGGAVTATLPAVSGIAGRVYTFKLVTAGNALTIDGNGDERIDGATTYATSTAKTAVTLQCDGVGWQIISEYTP